MSDEILNSGDVHTLMSLNELERAVMLSPSARFHLALEKKPLHPEQVHALTESPCFSALNSLELYYNQIGDEGVIALLNSPRLTGLTRFELGLN